MMDVIKCDLVWYVLYCSYVVKLHLSWVSVSDASFVIHSLTDGCDRLHDSLTVKLSSQLR